MLLDMLPQLRLRLKLPFAVLARVFSYRCVQFYVLPKFGQHPKHFWAFATWILALEQVVLTAILWSVHRKHRELVHLGQVVLTLHLELFQGGLPIKFLYRPIWFESMLYYKVFRKYINTTSDVGGLVWGLGEGVIKLQGLSYLGYIHMVRDLWGAFHLHRYVEVALLICWLCWLNCRYLCVFDRNGF